MPSHEHDFQINHSYDTTFLKELHALLLTQTRYQSANTLATSILQTRNAYMKASDPWQGLETISFNRKSDHNVTLWIESFGSGFKTLIDLGIITLTHFLILNGIVETHGLDVFNFASMVNATIHPYHLGVGDVYSSQTPLLAHRFPGSSHLNPWSKVPVKEQMEKFHQIYPQVYKPGQITSKNCPPDMATVLKVRDDGRLDYIPYHHRGKIFKFIENLAWENGNGYGFTSVINYLGYGDAMSKQFGPFLDIDSIESLNQFYGNQQQKQLHHCQNIGGSNTGIDTDSPPTTAGPGKLSPTDEKMMAESTPNLEQVTTEQSSFQSPIPDDLITYSLFPYTIKLSTLPHDPATGKIPLCALPTAFLTIFDLLAQCMAEIWSAIGLLFSECGDRYKFTLYQNGAADLISLYLLTPDLPSTVIDGVMQAIYNFTFSIPGQPQSIPIIKSLTTLLPLDLIFKHRLQKLIKFPFCLEAPQLSLLQGSGSTSISTILSIIIHILKSPTKIKSKDLRNYLTLGKICVRILMYVEWFESTIIHDSDRYDVFTIDQTDFKYNSDIYHRLFAAQSKPFGLLGPTGKPFIVNLVSPRPKFEKNSEQNLVFFRYTSKLEPIHETPAFKSVLSPDLINLTISLAIHRNYNISPLLELLTELSSNDATDALAPHQPLTFIGQHFLHNRPHSSGHNPIRMVKEVLWSISNTTASTSSDLSRFALVATDIPVFIQSVMYSVYHVMAAGCSGITTSPLDLTLTKNRGPYRHMSLAGHNIDKFSLKPRLLSMFLSKMDQKPSSHQLFEPMSRLINETIFIFEAYWQPSSFGPTLPGAHFPLEPRNDLTSRSFATLFLATHYSFSTTLYHLISTLDWSGHWVAETDSNGSGLVSASVCYLEALDNILGTPFFSLSDPIVLIQPKIERLPRELIKSTYILYIEAISRLILGFAHSGFHTSFHNAEWEGAGAFGANTRFGSWFSPDNNCKGTIYRQTPFADEYEANMKHLLDPQHKKNSHFLLHLPNRQYDGETIPYAFDRMTVMVQHCIELFIDLLRQPDQFELIKTIQFEVPDEKLPVYYEDFLSPYKENSLDEDLFMYDYGLSDMIGASEGRDDGIENQMSDQIRADDDDFNLAPIFENFREHNRGHLIKAIPGYIWDWIYKPDQKIESGLSLHQALIKVRKERLYTLAHSFPSRYLAISNTTSPTPGVFTYIDQFQDKPEISAVPSGRINQTAHNFQFRPHYQYQPFNQRDSKYKMNRLQDQNCFIFPTESDGDANHSDDSDDNGSDESDSDDGDASDDDDSDDGTNSTTFMTPFSYQHQRILPPPQPELGNAMPTTNNLLVPTNGHMPFFYNQTDEELDLLYEAFSSNRLFDIPTNKDSYQEWRKTFENRPLAVKLHTSSNAGSIEQTMADIAPVESNPPSLAPVFEPTAMIDSTNDSNGSIAVPATDPSSSLTIPSPTISLSKSLIHLLPDNYTFTQTDAPEVPLRLPFYDISQNASGQANCFIDLELLSYNINEYDNLGLNSIRDSSTIASRSFKSDNTSDFILANAEYHSSLNSKKSYEFGFIKAEAEKAAKRSINNVTTENSNDITLLSPCDRRIGTGTITIPEDEYSLMQTHFTNLKTLPNVYKNIAELLNKNNIISLYDNPEMYIPDSKFTLQKQHQFVNLMNLNQHQTLLPNPSTMITPEMAVGTFMFYSQVASSNHSTVKRLIGQHVQVSETYLFDHSIHTSETYAGK